MNKNGSTPSASTQDMKLTESLLRRIIREELKSVPDPITNIPYYDPLEDELDIDSLDAYDLSNYYEDQMRKRRKIPQYARYQDQADVLDDRIARIRRRGESM